MKKATSRFSSFIIVLLFTVNVQTSIGQVVQLTDGESIVNDSNYEVFFECNGEGCYTSFIDDRVNVYKLDSGELIYTTSFDLCDEEIAVWEIVGEEIVYVSNFEIIIEDISGSLTEVYPFEDPTIDYVSQLQIISDLGILHLAFFPNNERLRFDVKKRMFIDQPLWIWNNFVTTDYLYHQIGGFSGEELFIRLNRNTHVQDTLLRNFTSDINIRSSSDYYFFSSEELPLMLVYSNDDMMSFDFDHGSIHSGIITDDGKVVFAEILAGGTVIYTLDELSGTLISKDSIMSDNKIILLGSYGDRLYVDYSQQFITEYGYMDYPYTSVDIIESNSENTTGQYYSLNDLNLFLFNSYKDGHPINITIVEQESNEIHDFDFSTRSLWLDSPFEVVSTPQGLRFIVSEDDGKVIYAYDSDANTVNLIRSINNKRGLGTEVSKNDDGFLISEKHSLFSSFEYLHPVTLELLTHSVDGIIHGSVIPWEGKYYYIRNENYNEVDEDFLLDFVLFDPNTNEIDIIENDFFYPMVTSSFSNINFRSEAYGFYNIFNTALIFDLRNESLLSVDNETEILLNNIYHETDDHFYSENDQGNYRIDKTDYSNATLIFEGERQRLIPVDKNSFVMKTADDSFYYIKQNSVVPIIVSSNFAQYNGRVIKGKLFLIGYNGTQTVGVKIDLTTMEETPIEVDGFIFDYMDDVVFSANSVEIPIDLICSNISTGESITKSVYDDIVYADNGFFYIWEDVSTDLSIYNSQFELIDVIDGSMLHGGSIEIVSGDNALPVVYKVGRPRISNNEFSILRDYELAILDPSNHTLESYFTCEDDYRLNKIFSIDSISYMLLRTKEDGYQVCEFEIPNFTLVNTIDQTKPIDEVISLYPNPTSGIVTLNEEFDEVSVYNGMGKLLFSQNNTSSINLSVQSSGVYFLKIKVENGKYNSLRVVKL